MTAATDEPHIGLVVEGAGDTRAVPLLFRRFQELSGDYRDVLGKPVPVHGRGGALTDGGIEGYASVAGFRPGCRAVLVVLDGERDCVADLGPKLNERAQSAVQVPVYVCLADSDYEDWLYSSAETLDLDLEYQPQSRGQKQIVSALRPKKYAKPTWQPRLTSRMDIDLAKSRNTSLSRALDRFAEALRHLEG